MVAGPNGAGKTTCVQKKPIANLISNVTFFNTDDRTLLKLRKTGYGGFADAPEEAQTVAFIASANDVYTEIEHAVRQGARLGVETVLSTDKYRPVVESVKGLGGFVGLIYVALSSPKIAMQRVAYRVRNGGHGIPDAKIEQRWQRSLDNLRWFAENATAFWIFDNSSSNIADANVLIAAGQYGVLEYLADSPFSAMKSALAGIPVSRQ